MKSIKVLLKSLCFILTVFSTHGFSETISKIEIIGNDRISDETIKMFISSNTKNEINDLKLNQILKELYDTEYFEDVTVKFENKTLLINVVENPIIENISYKGIKSSNILEIIKDETLIKSRSSYNEITIKKDKLKITNILKNLGYYNSSVDVFIDNSKNNLINITFDINLGKKAKISKITFIGNKIFKDKKLRRIITSTEYKFWKFISGRKYLNQNTALFDERLLKNFYKNNGYYKL
jgi:outer membrane protein insertion porin family